MKRYYLKAIAALVLVIASLVLTLQVPKEAYATRADKPVSYTLENIFNAKYGDNEEDVTAGCLEPSNAGITEFYPEIYAVSDNDDVYVVDTYNPVQPTPIKHFDCNGKYIRTLSCRLFTDGEILSMIAFGDILYLRTSDDFLCCFNMKTDEVKKHSIEKVDGFNYYGMETVENCIALIYEQEIETKQYYELRFQTFDTDKQEFVQSDDIISVDNYMVGNQLKSKIKFGDFLIDLNLERCNLPIGISKDGNLIISHHYALYDTYAEYDINGMRQNYGDFDNDKAFTQYMHIIRNQMTTWKAVNNEESNTFEYVICNVKMNNGTIAEEEWLRMPLFTLLTLFGDIDVPDEYLTSYIKYENVQGEADAGPMHYTIMDSGDIFILDDMREDAPIKHYSKDGEYIETIYSKEFSGFDYGFANLVAVGDKLYVTPCVEYNRENSLCEYDPVNKTIEKYPFPQSVMGSHMSKRALVAVGKYLVFDSYGYEAPIWMFDTEKHEFITDTSAYMRYYDKATGKAVIKTDGKEYFISIPEVGELYPVGFDNDGNIIVHYIFDGISYRKYTPDGKLLAFAEEEYRDEAYYLEYPERVINGELIRARTTKDVYSLDKVVFNEDYFKDAYDINFDGVENTADAVMILRYCVELTEFDRAQAVKADVTGDCKTNTADAVAVLRYTVELT